MDNATIFLICVDAYPYEFEKREREAFSKMHPGVPERSRYLYILRLLEQAGYCTVIAFPARQPIPRAFRKREWVTIL